MQRTQRTLDLTHLVHSSIMKDMFFLLTLGCVLIAFCIPVLAQMTESFDQQITRELQRKLQEDNIVSAHLIDIETSNGVVTLSGTVDSLLEEARAIRIAENMKGVLRVMDKLTVVPVMRSDVDILTDVESALAVDPATDSYEIAVTVNDGIVTLTGSVESFAEKEIAARVVKGVKGVVDVENELDITYPVARSDSEIQAEIERRLELNPSIKESLIQVQVEDGEATVSGTVATAAERTQVVNAAWTSGVSEVNTSGLFVDWEASQEALEMPTIRTDEEIRRAVQDALAFEPRVLSTNVDVSVENGVATLTGTVDSYNARWLAEQTARDVTNVWRVKNYLRVRFDDMRTDTEIAEDVEDALSRDPLVESFDMTVEVINGKVYLRGLVDYYSEKQQAEDVASRVNGVVDVQNHVKVDSEITWKSDQEIKEDIQGEYFWSPYVDGDTITVLVDDGTAILSGEVQSWDEHEAAVNNAFEGGATSVKSYLDIDNLLWESDTPRYYNRYTSAYDMTLW